VQVQKLLHICAEKYEEKEEGTHMYQVGGRGAMMDPWMDGWMDGWMMD
jgi:hypothetical protein